MVRVSAAHIRVPVKLFVSSLVWKTKKEEKMAADEPPSTTDETPEGVKTLMKWLNKSMRIKLTDGRILIGVFVCTDKDCNVILGSCQEYLQPPEVSKKEEPRVLGLAMVPGHHIITIEVDEEGPNVPI